ncbi:MULTISPECIES: OPT family oligopeptide transporter [Corallococcus]|uniref:OPT family oligopeptide transporter n=1 Tax=Corallococcus TaxID=83461 RepID=UPI00117DBE20|nr:MULTISPECIES: OPT family oligopeptide transporter [Corallococcus]NBD08838.1 OPT family oligopeptide transporter [Corallococcus silvisoli]TSC32787.1 OPT family oligopeptide transporter [Corallococcus sp. Z5C101001]
MPTPAPRAVPAGDPPSDALPPSQGGPGATQEDVDTHWLTRVYQGDRMPQLTLRAVALGAGLGVLTCATNLYAGLKTGVAFGVAVTAALLASATHGALRRVSPRVAGAPLSLLELGCAQTVASSAGYATGGALVSVQGAWLLTTGHHLPVGTLLAWTFLVSALGVFFAVPLKRQLVDREQLPFASGTAAAATARALHAEEGAAVPRLRMLGVGGAVAGALTLVRDGFGRLPYAFAFPGALGGVPLERLGFALETGLMPVGGGALLGVRITASMLLGALVVHGVVAPRLMAAGVVSVEGDFLAWALWPGAAALTTASLLQFVLQARVFGRALRGLRTRDSRRAPHPILALQVPARWWGAGMLVLTPATVALARIGFDVPVPHALLAVALSFVLCLISCRVTGETDVSPVGALGQVTQLTYGVLMPGDVRANLATAGLTVNAAASSADMLTDLKAGHLLGADPRRVFLAQLLGCVVGSLVVVPLFYLLVPDASALGSERFPAPAATVTASVARVLATGWSAVSPDLRIAMAWAALGAAVLTLGEQALPERFRRWAPSAVGVGLACLLPPSTCLGFFLGGLGWELARQWKPAWEAPGVTLAAGLIAGEGVVGVGIVLARALW